MTEWMIGEIIAVASMAFKLPMAVWPLAVAAILGISADAQAITYCGPAPPCIAFGLASVIFEGELLAIAPASSDDPQSDKRLRFAVREVFRGQAPRILEITDTTPSLSDRRRQ